jgi:DNA-directed RNA polymerase specialized sigma24 family protein
MAPEKSGRSVESITLDETKLLAGVLAMMIAEREERLEEGAEVLKTEVILENAGFSAGEISRLTGKNYEAVKKTLQRARSRG